MVSEAMLPNSLAATAEQPIFVIDDDPAILGSLKFALEVEGYTVRAYPSARAVLADAARSEPGCLIIDYNLPEGDAFSALDDLKAHGVAGSTIIITSNPAASVRRRAAAQGIRIVEKPLFGNVLIEALREALRH
jgi:FixJ family two-component response regulator